jgi:tellurite resistance protein TerC
MGLKAARELRAGTKKKEEEDDAPRASRPARLIERFVPISEHFEGDRFTTEVGGRTYATPLVLAVVTILVADVVFALDSIPAVLAVSTNPIVVVTSNVFAVLGLRSMFFVLQGLLARLKYLPHGLAAVLIVVGTKMLLGSIVAIPTVLSLASVLAVLGVAVFFSLSAKGISHAERS